MLKPGKARDYRDREYATKSTAIAKPAQTRSALEVCEAEIDNGLRFAKNAFHIIARNVARVKDGKLWQGAGYESFDDWCQKKYGWSAGRGLQYTDAQHMLEGLPEAVTTIVVNESQARALTAVPAAKRVKVIQRVAKRGPVTAKRIKAEAARSAPVTINVKPEPPRPEPAEKHCPTCGQIWEKKP